MIQTAEAVPRRESDRDAGRTALAHIPALDGLRGLAVAAVLLFHAGHLTGGYLGVDLFFVLSGFLITSLMLAETARTGRISLLAFWARRARRLLPALAGVLIGVAAYAWLFAEPAELARIRSDALATVLYVANWRAVFAHLDYWELFAAPSPLAHTWSLAIEEQFYLVWPLVVSGVLWWQTRHRRGSDSPGRAIARNVLIVSVVLAVTSAIWMTVGYGAGNTTRVYYGSDTRAASILVGAALAALLALRGPARARITRYGMEAAGVVAALVIAFAWMNVAGESDRLYRGVLFACAVAAAAVIAAASHPDRGPIARVLSARPLRWLGLISYGVYLWHWPVYILLNEDRAHLGGWGLVALRVATTLAIAAVSYVVLEQPIRRGALRPGQMRVLIPVAAVVLVGAIVASTGGRDVTRVAAAATPDAVQDALQEADRAPGARRVLVVGNSVGWFLGEGFKQLRPDPPLVVLNRARIACTFPPDVTRARTVDGTVFPSGGGCTDSWASDVAAFDPDLVVFIIGAGDAALEHEGRWLAPCTPGFDRWYRRELREGMKVLGSHGARVAITTGAYSVTLSGPSETKFDRTDCTNRIHRAVAAEDGDRALLDVARYICPTRSCRTKEGDMHPREDGVHFRGESARWMAGWMLDQADRASSR